MNNEWTHLIARANAVARKKNGKPDLQRIADALGVKYLVIYDAFIKGREPRASTALALLRWVEKQECAAITPDAGS